MSGDPFESGLSNLFLEPSGEADPARLTVRVLERLDQEERQRRVVIIGAAAIGAAITAFVMAASGASKVGALVAAQLSSIVPSAVDSTPSVAVMALLVGLTLAGLYTTRAVRDL